MILVFTLIENHFHRNALHHFDVVAGGVFGRQQAEARARCGGDAIDVPAVLAAAAVGIDFKLDLLADVHFLELGLFEIGGDPDVFERNERHDLLTGRDLHTGFGRFAADHAVYRGFDQV